MRFPKTLLVWTELNRRDLKGCLGVKGQPTDGRKRAPRSLSCQGIITSRCRRGKTCLLTTHLPRDRRTTVAIAPIPVSRGRGRPTRCNLYFCVQPTHIREMKRVTKVFRGYFSLCCPAEKEKKPSFGGLEQEAGMKVPTCRAAVFTVFFS